jgi:fatty-acyl-CoA synthase
MSSCAHWPPGVPRQVAPTATHLFRNVEAAAGRFGPKPFIVCRDTVLTHAQLREQAEAVAGWLQQACGVRRGDRVLLALPNGPQWALACFGILRADAVVVPLNPMSRREELELLATDSGATVAFVTPALLGEVTPLLGGVLERVVLVDCGEEPPRPVTLSPQPDTLLVAWDEVMACPQRPGPVQAGADDAAVMPYTSGTTGRPKGCVHTHRSVMSAVVAGATWFSCPPDAVFLATLPFFHVTGFVGSLNVPLYVGATVAVLPRWSRSAAAAAMQRHRVTHWHATTTMVVDLLAHRRLEAMDLSSLRCIRGGGAAMPEAVAQRLKTATGQDYIEGYGLTETMAATHLNPPQRPKPQCLGLPLFGVDACVVEPGTLRELPRGESGEILIHAPQLMQGYWRQPGADAEAFVHIDGKRFLRTGDLGHVDEDGYFFMTDRLKRMINAAGYKVWPAEVEALLYRHPAVQEACVIATPDTQRGEAVKALVVLRPDTPSPSARELIAWTRRHLAAYKCPRIVQFVPSLPRSASGKVMWRALQARERAGAAAS